MTLPGRCKCGIILAWATGDEHLDCEGLGRCRDCRKVFPLWTMGGTPGNLRCRTCRRALLEAYVTVNRGGTLPKPYSLRFGLDGDLAARFHRRR